jgi:excisionase family DNA binding protein
MDSTHLTLDLENKAGIARKLKCSTRTINNLMANGAIPFIRFGRLVRFDVARVKAALQRFEIAPAGQKNGHSQ